MNPNKKQSEWLKKVNDKPFLKGDGFKGNTGEFKFNRRFENLSLKKHDATTAIVIKMASETMIKMIQDTTAVDGCDGTNLVVSPQYFNQITKPLDDRLVPIKRSYDLCWAKVNGYNNHIVIAPDIHESKYIDPTRLRILSIDIERYEKDKCGHLVSGVIRYTY